MSLERSRTGCSRCLVVKPAREPPQIHEDCQGRMHDNDCASEDEDTPAQIPSGQRCLARTSRARKWREV